MRITQDYKLKDRVVLFDGDIPGGCRVVTPSGVTIEWMEFTNDEPMYDPKDGKEIFYPGWCEW